MTTKITINNIIITGATIGSLRKAIGSVDEKLTTFANAAAAQYVINGNRNWLDSLFQLDELRLKSGKLSAKGKEVAAYIRAFSPVNVAEKDENGIQTVSFKMNAKNKNVFYSLEQDKEGNKIKLDASEHTTWPMTLREFSQRDKPAKAPAAEKAKKASTLESQLGKMVASIDANGVDGSFEEVSALLAAIEKLQASAIAKLATAKQATADIEPTAAEMAANVTSGKEQRSDVDRAKHADSPAGQLTMPMTTTKAKSKVAATA